MFKICLGIILAAGVSYLGISKSVELKKRVDILKELSDVFEYIGEIVRLYRPPQMKLFKLVAGNSRFSHIDIFPRMYEYLKLQRDMQKAFASEIEKSAMRFYLDREELVLIEDFFVNTAYLDYDGYIKNCNALSERMREIYDRANEDYKQKGRLTASLGILGGIFLFIIIL